MDYLKEIDMVIKEEVSAYIGSLESHTLENDYFREVLYTGKYAQLVLMCLKPSEEIGNGVHFEADQFFYSCQRGKAELVLNGKETHALKSGDAVLVLAGIIDKTEPMPSRTGKLKFYTIFSPPSQPAYKIFKTKADAEKAESEVHNMIGVPAQVTFKFLSNYWTWQQILSDMQFSMSKKSDIALVLVPIISKNQ